MRRIVLTFALLGALLVLAPAANAHQVTPPGQGAPACTTTLHAGDATNPAHTGGVAVADTHTVAISPGFCQ